MKRIDLIHDLEKPALSDQSFLCDERFVEKLSDGLAMSRSSGAEDTMKFAVLLPLIAKAYNAIRIETHRSFLSANGRSKT